MKCEKYLDMMSLYIDNHLEDEDLEDFKEHINTCSSCLEEFIILKEVINNINGLEQLELPEQFHQELMSKIQTKPSQKWKIVSAIAAGFLITFIALDNFKLQPTKDAIPESTNIQTRSLMKEDAMTAEMMPKIAQDFSLEQIEIETSAYDNSKDIIDQISQDMNLQEEILEEVVVEGGRELTLQLTLRSSEKKQFLSRIQELCENTRIISQEEDNKQVAVETDNEITILIRLIEVK